MQVNERAAGDHHQGSGRQDTRAWGRRTSGVSLAMFFDREK